MQKLAGFWKAMDAASAKDAVVSIYGASFTLIKNAAIPMLIISQCGWDLRTGWPVFAGTACFVSYPEIKMTSMARFVVSELQRFFAYTKIVHCGLSGRKPEGVGVTQYLIDLARKLPFMCEDKIFGINGHTNVVLGSTCCMVPLLDASTRDMLMSERVGVFQTLPLNTDKVWRAIHDLLKSAPFITGDHGIYQEMYKVAQEWVQGPEW